MLNFAVTATCVPAASRTARATCARETGAVLDRAAVAVAPLVQPRAEERAQQVVVAHVDLDRVEAALDEALGPRGVVGGDAGDVVVGDALREPHPDRREHARRREGRVLRPHRVRDRTRVADLRARGGALGVDRVGQPAQARDRVVGQDDLPSVGGAVTRDRAVRDRRHPHAAGGDRAMELDQPVGDDALRRRALEGRRLDDPVAQRQGAELGRCERVHRWDTTRHAHAGTRRRTTRTRASCPISAPASSSCSIRSPASGSSTSAAGTARSRNVLIEAGAEVVGVDGSPDMIAAARATRDRCPRRGRTRARLRRRSSTPSSRTQRCTG